MDRKSFELLNSLNNKNKPTLEDCQLKECQENYNYLLDVGYLEHKSGKLDVRVTRLGIEAIEKYQIQEKLFLLQEQNTEIQSSLRIIQWALVILTVIQILLKVFSQ